MNKLLLRLAITSGVLVLAGTARAAVQSDVEYRSYDAYAERGKSLYQTLAAASPFHENGHPFLGHTSRDIRWHLHWRDSGGGMCRVNDVSVTLHTTIVLPQLAGVDSDRQTEYARFLIALRIHENGHYRIEQEMANEIDRSLASLPETSCASIEGAANARASEIVRDYNGREVQYDAETDHGRSQGAFLRN